MSDADDSVPIPFDAESEKGAADPSRSGSHGYRPLASLVALFVLIVLSDTDIFLNDFLAHAGDTMRPSGIPNMWGSVVRALVLVVLFAVVVTLLQHRVI